LCLLFRVACAFKSKTGAHQAAGFRHHQCSRGVTDRPLTALLSSLERQHLGRVLLVEVRELLLAEVVRHERDTREEEGQTSTAQQRKLLDATHLSPFHCLSVPCSPALPCKYVGHSRLAPRNSARGSWKWANPTASRCISSWSGAWMPTASAGRPRTRPPRMYGRLSRQGQRRKVRGEAMSRTRRRAACRGRQPVRDCSGGRRKPRLGSCASTSGRGSRGRSGARR